MTLEQLAKKAGVELVACDAEWGGRIAYKSPDAPGSQVCGFRTEAAAYRHWAENTFGKLAAKAVFTLLDKSRPAAVSQEKP